MAIAFTWGGFADTGIQLSEFVNSDYTIALRFLCRYPHGYTGPFFANGGPNRKGKFLAGQGNYASGLAKDLLKLIFPAEVGLPKGISNLFIRPGSDPQTVLLFDEFQWHHFALVSNNNSIQPFLDGKPVGAPFARTQTELEGSLILGRAEYRAMNAKSTRGTQFFGLLDDLAIFKSALSNTRIKNLAAANRLTGKESGLFVGYTFGFIPPDGLPETLSRKLVTISPAAEIVNVSADRNATIDLPLVPLPLNSHMNLPFPRGQKWRVSQGFHNREVSHNGYATFSHDFVCDGGGTEGEPFFAAAPGIVSDILESQQDETDKSNFLTIEQASGEFCDYLHLVRNSVKPAKGAKVGFGTELAATGRSGTGDPHLHLALTTIGEGNSSVTPKDFFTIPYAFSNYEAKSPTSGEWRRVIRGIPRKDEIVRRPAKLPPMLFNAVWIPGDEPEFQLYNVPFLDYATRNSELAATGWRHHSLSVVTVSGTPRYTAVWRKTDIDETPLYAAKKQAFKDKHAELTADGWSLHILSIFTLNSSLRYSAIWRKGASNQHVEPSLTLPELKAKFAELEDTMQLQCLESTSIGLVDWYAAVWRKSRKTSRHFIAGVTAADFRAKYDEIWGEGFRLSHLTSTFGLNQLLYSAQWFKSTSKEIQVLRWEYEDYRSRYDVLWRQGWRLKILSPYRNG